MAIPTTIARGVLLLLAAVPAAAVAQVVALPQAPARPITWVSGGGALLNVQAYSGGEDGGHWSWSDGVQLRGTVERALRADMTVGVTGTYARLPLSVSGGTCGSCRGDGTVWQALATLRLGGGRGVGFHSVLAASAGVTGFTSFERGSDPSSVPGPLTTAAQSLLPTVSAAYGAGYTLSPGLEIEFVHEIGVMFHSPSDAAPDGATTTPRVSASRLTLRYALGRAR